jgi:hypothetical protein
MRKTVISLLLCLFAFQSFSQLKLIEKLFPSDTTRHNSFIPLPVFGYSQESGFQFGAVGLYSFYIDKKDLNIRPSQLYGVAYTSTKGQSQISIKSDLWSRKNKWHHIYEARYYKLPMNFYGIGSETFLADKDRITQKKMRFNAEIERAITPNYYPGIGIEFEHQSFKDIETGGIFETSNQLYAKDGGKYMLFKISQMVDTRNNTTYTEKGFYTRLRYGFAPDLFGGDNFTGSLFTVDSRYFKSLGKKVVFANQFVLESLTSNKSKEVPLYMLRQMGNDQLMRGYYQGRYRDQHYLAFQSELRYRFVDRFGIVAFGGVGSVHGQENFSTNNLKPNYGIGGRFFFDLEKKISIRIDYGMGEKPPGEKRISGLYISLGESF